MSITTAELTEKKCTPCEGGVPTMPIDDVQAHLAAIPGWLLSEDGKSIQHKYKFKDFVQAMAFLQKVADLAEAEQHHPDLHLTGYRQVMIEISTHAIDGLSVNDFILAAKIDELPAA